MKRIDLFSGCFWERARDDDTRGCIYNGNVPLADVKLHEAKALAAAIKEALQEQHAKTWEMAKTTLIETYTEGRGYGFKSRLIEWDVFGDCAEHLANIPCPPLDMVEPTESPTNEQA